MGGERLREESAEALAEGRLKEKFQDSPIEFITSREEVLEEEASRFAQIRSGDLDLTPIEFDDLEPKYTIGKPDGRALNPQSFRENGIDDFLRFWNREIGDEENFDLDYAEQVLKKERSGTEKGLRERFELQPHSREVLQNDSRNPVYEAVIEEMIQTLYGQALNKPEEFKSEVESFERVLKNYDPEPYREVVENSHSYTIEHLTEVDDMISAAKASGSCIDENRGRFRNYADDEFSMISEIKKDGDSLGYLRNFLMEDERGKEVLAMDTVEVDHKNFEGNKDAVKAAGMASIQMMYDLEADYLVGADARVKYGLRQGFSNSEKSLNARKLGENRIGSYSFSTRNLTSDSAYLLMENPG